MARGDIYYSQRANRFYQEGRRGAVSRDTAVRSLKYDRSSNTFVDGRGRTITSDLLSTSSRSVNRFWTHDEKGRVFVTGEASSRSIPPGQSSTVQVKGNQDITVRTVVTTGDGRTHVFHNSYGFGKNVSEKFARDDAAKKARAALKNTTGRDGKKYSLNTNDVKNQTQRQDFFVRTVKLR